MVAARGCAPSPACGLGNRIWKRTRRAASVWPILRDARFLRAPQDEVLFRGELLELAGWDCGLRSSEEVAQPVGHKLRRLFGQIMSARETFTAHIRGLFTPRLAHVVGRSDDPFFAP